MEFENFGQFQEAHSEKDLTTYANTQNFISKIPNFDEAIEGDDLKDYPDPYTTKEQKARDEMISSLLQSYVTSYHNKVTKTQRYREKILNLCKIIIYIFSASFAFAGIYILLSSNVLKISHLIAFVTSCISFVSLIIGVLKIVTKYFFPEDDEQYITKIVESIQNNDLKNKQENARNSTSDSNEDLKKFVETKLGEISDELKRI